MSRLHRALAIIAPGLLVAATGVGAGDLATAGFAGSKLGAAILWAIAIGAAMKFVLNEGLARWQLATGETILEGALRRFGRAGRIAFGVYLLPWSFFVGAALISACGVTAAAIVEPLGWFPSDRSAKLVLGAGHSVAGVALAWFGGYRLFERIMAVCVAVMFVAVIVTAFALRPDPSEIVGGLLVPRIPQLVEGGLTWTIALMGGVGGTLTVICYGYWMREAGRDDVGALRTCRIDLAVAYGVTALFGIAMVIIARGMVLNARGAGLIVALADQLEVSLGAGGRWVFLAGAWAAVFSSLLGVWQAVPYVFADFVGISRERGPSPARFVVDVRSVPYRLYLVALATIPLVGVAWSFREVQKFYAVIGAAFIPILALVLLVLNGRRDLVGPLRNRPLTTVALVVVLLAAATAGVYNVAQRW